MKERMSTTDNDDVRKAHPPPKKVLDSAANVAFFAKFLLLGTADEEYANA